MINGFQRPASDSQPGGAVSGHSVSRTELLVSRTGSHAASDAADFDQYRRSLSQHRPGHSRSGHRHGNAYAKDILNQVEIPLALPVVISGIKTATVEVIASATLAAFVGAGGLGAFIVLGFAAYDPAILLVGAIPVAILALIAEVGLSALQKAAQPPV
jgi:hypothetical protein